MSDEPRTTSDERRATNDARRAQGDDSLRETTRRHFFRDAGFGIGSLALAALMRERLFAFTPEADAVLSQAARAVAPQIAAKAKQVIYLFMAGAPSQVDLFDNKPLLQKHDGQEIPPGFIPEGERFAFVKGTPRLLGSPFNFTHHGQSSGGDLRAAASSRRARGRNRRHPIDEDDTVQSRAGADLHEHRPSDHRPSEHRILALVRAWQRQQGPAGVRRAHLGPEQSGRRQELLGQRLPAHGAPGRGVPVEGRAGAVLAESGRHRRSHPA